MKSMEYRHGTWHWTGLNRSNKSIRIDYQQTDIDWNDYFFDIIGVTRYQDKGPGSVVLEYTKEMAPYMKTKPLHLTQKTDWKEDKLQVTIEVIPNFELESLILFYGEKVSIKKPEFFNQRLVSRISQAKQSYN